MQHVNNDTQPQLVSPLRSSENFMALKVKTVLVGADRFKGS